MSFFAASLFGLFLSASASDADSLGDPSKPVKVFLLVDQSNMQGYGIVKRVFPQTIP